MMTIFMATIWLALPAAAGAAETTQTLTLAQALSAADENNLSLSALRLENDKAQGQLTQAVGGVLPVASASLDYVHADHEDTMDMTSGITDVMEDAFEGMPFEMGEMEEGEPTIVRQQEDLSGSLTVSLSVLNAQNWARIDVGRKGKDLAELSVEDTRQGLLLVVAQAWYASRTSATLVALYEEQVTSAEHHLEVAQARQEAGTGLRLDLLRAETDLAEARQELLQAQLALDNARDALGVLTGVGGLPTPVDEPTIRMPGGEEDQLLAGALQSRTDLAVSQASVDLSRSQLSLTRAQFAPSIDLAWQGSYQFTEATDMGSDDPSRWSAIATLTVPIYNHFRYGELKERKAALRQAELQLEDARINASQEVRQARRDHETELSATEIARGQAALTAEALVLARAAYEEGAGSSLDVTDARRSAASSELNLASHEMQASIAQLQLLRSLGEDVMTVVTP